jgi:hypothetical protein
MNPVVAASSEPPRRSRMSAPRWFYVSLAAVALLLWGVFVWPTAYRYDHYTADGTTRPIRMNRLTGMSQVWTPTGWRGWR